MDTKVVNYSDPERRERTPAGSVFQHLSREQKQEKKVYYLAISDRPNFPSPFRSNILSYKVEAEYRQKGTKEKDSQKIVVTAVRKSKIVPNKFHPVKLQVLGVS